MNEPIIDFFDHIPSKEEKIEVRWPLLRFCVLIFDEGFLAP